MEGLDGLGWIRIKVVEEHTHTHTQNQPFSQINTIRNVYLFGFNCAILNWRWRGGSSTGGADHVKKGKREEESEGQENLTW